MRGPHLAPLQEQYLIVTSEPSLQPQYFLTSFSPSLAASLTSCATPASRGRRSSTAAGSASLPITATARARRMLGWTTRTSVQPSRDTGRCPMRTSGQSWSPWQGLGFPNVRPGRQKWLHSQLSGRQAECKCLRPFVPLAPLGLRGALGIYSSDSKL